MVQKLATDSALVTELRQGKRFFLRAGWRRGQSLRLEFQAWFEDSPRRRYTASFLFGAAGMLAARSAPCPGTPQAFSGDSPPPGGDPGYGNQPPWAEDDYYSVLHDQTLSDPAPGVLWNDYDPENDPLTAQLISGPQNGSVTLNPDGSFTYEPDPGFAGQDSFTYQAHDGTQGSNTATVWIDVVNTPPQAMDDDFNILPSMSAFVEAPGVLGNDFDLEDDPLTAQLVSGPQNGTVTLNPDGSFTYNPFPGFRGTDSFSYRAFDGISSSAISTVFLNIDGPEVTLKSVTFENEHEISSDVPNQAGNYTIFKERHWLDANLDGDADDNGDRKWPVAYTRGTRYQASVEVVLDAPWQGPPPLIRGDGPTLLDIPSTVAQVQGTSVSLANVQATAAFPNTVKYYNTFDISWQISVDGGKSWSQVGTSSNELYLTWNNPLSSPLFWTVVHIGSKNADGKALAEDVVSMIWNEFSDRNVRRRDGTRLTYWKNGNQCVATDTKSLLRDTDGQCGSWAEFLIDVISGQGIPNASKVMVLNKDLTPATPGYGLLVKEWLFRGPPAPQFASPNPDYPYFLPLEVLERPGVPGQGNPNPPSAFVNHFIVRWGNQYYDPSYGGPVYPSQAAWENASLAGFVFTDQFGLTWAKKNNPNVIETKFQ